MATIDQLSFDDIEKLLDLAKNTPLFQNISLSERMDLMEKATVVSKLKGEILYFQDDEAPFFFLLYTGRLLEYEEHGKERKILRVIKPGTFFGTKDTVENGKYTTTVKAIEESTIVSFPREEMVKILQKYPSLKDNI